MFISSIFYVFSVAALAVAQSSTEAPVVNGNPAGATFAATLQSKEAGNNGLRGTVTGVSGTNGTGVLWAISLSGLPTTGGPFSKLESMAIDSFAGADRYSVPHS